MAGVMKASASDDFYAILTALSEEHACLELPQSPALLPSLTDEKLERMRSDITDALTR